MAKRKDYLTLTFAVYKDPTWGKISLGPGRYSFNLHRLSLIIEMWWVRGGLGYN